MYVLLVDYLVFQKGTLTKRKSEGGWDFFNRLCIIQYWLIAWLQNIDIHAEGTAQLVCGEIMAFSSGQPFKFCCKNNFLFFV